MEQPKTERMLRIMKMLTENDYYTVEDLAERLHTSYRTIYRYIDTFKAAGFVVHKEGNIYRLGKESKYFNEISQLIHFTDEEAYIINQLIDAVDDNNLLKQNLRKKLVSVYNCTSVADCVVKGSNATNVHTLIEAIENKKQVLFKNYASPHNTSKTNRLVEPFAFTTNYVQVWCYELATQSNKLFKTARIEAVEELDNQWTEEAQHVQADLDIFRMSGQKVLPVKLKLGILAHNLLIEEYPLAEREISQIADDKWVLETTVCNFKGVARFVIGLADDITIVESKQLKDYIADFCKDYLEKL